MIPVIFQQGKDLLRPYISDREIPAGQVIDIIHHIILIMVNPDHRIQTLPVIMCNGCLFHGIWKVGKIMKRIADAGNEKTFPDNKTDGIVRIRSRQIAPGHIDDRNNIIIKLESKAVINFRFDIIAGRGNGPDVGIPG